METNQPIASKSGIATTTLQTSQPSEKASTDTYQHWAETAIIGEDTRRLLIAWSKLNDAANEYSELIDRLYTSQADQMLNTFWVIFSKVSDEILNMIPAFIIEGKESSRGQQAEI